MGWEGGVHFALGLDGRRRHGTDGRRGDERVRPAFSRAHEKLKNFRVVETRRDVTTFSLETLRVANQEACSLDLLCVSGEWGRRRNGRPPKQIRALSERWSSRTP